MASDDESSDSSNDFLVSPSELNLDDLRVGINNNQRSIHRASSDSSLSSSEDDFAGDSDNDEEMDSAELLAQVMRNLSKTNDLISIESVKDPSSSLISDRAPSISSKTNISLSDEINDLLLKGESQSGSTFAADEYEKSTSAATDNTYSIPSEGVNIILPDTTSMFGHRKKRKDIDLQSELIKKMNRRLKLNQLFIHKVGLLCWLAHGFHLNHQINDPEVLAIAMSLVCEKNYPKGKVDIKYLESFTRWFNSIIKLELKKISTPISKEILINRLKEKKVYNHQELVMLCISVLRGIGLNCRLVISLYPPSLKLNSNQHIQATNDNNDKKYSIDEKLKDRSHISKLQQQRSTDKKLQKKNSTIIISENSTQAKNESKEDAKKKAAEILRIKFSRDDKKKISKNHMQHQDSNLVGKERKEKKKSIQLNKKEKKLETSVKSRNLRSRIINQVQSLPSTSGKNITPNDDSLKKNEDPMSEDSDCAWTLEMDVNEKPKIKFEQLRDESIDRRIFSTDEENEEEKSINLKRKKKDIQDLDEIIDQIHPEDACYLWVEVYAESEANWICILVPDCKVHCVSEIYKKIPSPVLYIIAWNSMNKVKDVTRRYCPNWLTITRKKRVDQKWWSDTLSLWEENQTILSKDEDELLLRTELEQPLPKTISECKGHPLYVLTRHLLKFEALYPADCVPLGHLKNGEAIYSRYCVHTLRSRETWLRQARIVKAAQEPYKVVKSMPKYDKLSGTVVKDMPLELFGKWQTVPYVPPEAKNGVVPRNEYGNVDLFQECMLPKGTVHLDLPGLLRVAKKLNIDCVPAVVGFNFGGRGAMPMTQGYVVCEEFKDTLCEAWENDRIESARRAQEKRDKRIWTNWRKLIKGLLIRENIAVKYLESSESTSLEKAPPLKRTKHSTKSIKKRKT